MSQRTGSFDTIPYWMKLAAETAFLTMLDSLLDIQGSFSSPHLNPLFAVTSNLVISFLSEVLELKVGAVHSDPPKMLT